MIAGPILRRELRATAGRRGLFVLRTSLGVVLAVLSLATVGAMESRRGPEAASLTPERLRESGQAVLVMLAVVQVIAWAILIPGLVAGAIAEERQRGTLDALLLTRLSNAEILAHKLIGRLIPALSLILVGLPFLIAAGCCAGLPVPALALIVAMEVSTVAFMGVLALFTSSRCQQVGMAKALAMALIWGWLILPPLLAIIPTGAGLLAEVWAAIRSAFALIAASSPLSLVTPPFFWSAAGGIEPLRERAAWMVATQAALAAPALIGAAIALGRRSGRPPVADPARARDGRPPCGDEPVFWREFDLPHRIGFHRQMLTLARGWLGLIRQMVVTLAKFALLSLVLGIPLAAIGAAGHYGALAFAEEWRFGFGSVEPFSERAAFNQVIRITAGFLGFIWLIGLTAAAPTRITTERDKQTWDSLLTTPLTGREILGGKMWAGACAIRPIAGWLAMLLVLGVAAGSITPLGAIWVGLDLPLAIWAGIAAGTWIGARPGTSVAAANRSGVFALVLTAFHLPLIVAALASGPEVAAFGAMAGWFRLVVTSSLIGVPTVTGVQAWAMTRRNFARFDEWAGRPRRGGARPPSSAD